MNRHRLLPTAGLVIGLGFTLAGGTAALPEISPVWQAFYGLTPPFDPFADLDHDGWDFREESAAGTSPFSPNVPDGFLIPNITVDSESPSVVTVSFGPSLFGKKYRLMASTDLTEGSWFEAAEPVMGYGGPLEFKLNVSHEDGSQPPKLFYRIAVADVPSPSGAISGRSQWDDYMLSIHPGIDPNPNPPGNGTEPPPNLDSDTLDSTLDAVDTDPLIRWRKTRDNSYFWIPVTGAAGLQAVDCNDKGQLLFSASVDQLSDLPTHPVGKIWDPAKPLADRWTNLFFAPQSFKLNALKHVGADPEIFEHTVLFPLEQSEHKSYSLYLVLRALGDDGSVLANASFGFSEMHDLETPALSGSNDQLVFLWKGSNRTAPQLFDENRGYTSDTSHYTRNGVVGFYTDTSGSEPVVKALVLDQEMVTTSFNSVSELYLKVLPINGGPMVTRLMHHQREMAPAPSYATSQSGVTPNGRFIIANSRQLSNGPPYHDIYYTSASAGGAAGRISVPRAGYDTVLELPTGEWGLGNATGLVRVAQGDTNFATTTITGVVQFDRQGTGIGSGSNNLHIWKNGRWMTLRQATGRDDIPADVRPKKITASGVVWAANETGTVNGILLPVELISDLDNDGYITGTDNPFRDAANAGGANDPIKDKGTEFIFHNDFLSNGLWDKEDSDPARPPSKTEDDDAEEITIRLGISEGDVWLDHPAIAGLSFYKTRDCNAADKVNLSPTNKFHISPSNPLPNRLFMRADGNLTYTNGNPQIAGDLVLKCKVGTSEQQFEVVKMKLTVVKALGAKKYFNAARDYMIENNSRLCVRKETVGNAASPSYKRVVSMLHEKTQMKAVDSFHRNPKLWGIDAVAASFPTYDVVINGNFCYSSDPAWWSSNRPQKNSMTDKCHGRLITNGVAQASSSTGGESIYEGPSADFIGWNPTSGIQIGTGVVPVSPATYTEALGGFGSNLLAEGGWHPWYGVANAGDKKVFFTATPFTVDGSGAGGRAELRQKLLDSGCPPLPGGQPGEIQCIYGDGGSSLGLTYKIDGRAMTKLRGSKHASSTGILPQRGDYFINAYLLFESANPR